MEHDVVMVACLLHEHPLPADQTAQLLQGLRELSFSATFRETVFGPLSEARAAQLAANLLRDGGDAALTILRNACGSSRALQRAVAAGVARGEPERGAERPLALQMVCNAAVQNPEAAEAIAGGWRAAAVDGRNAAVVAALLHTLRVWCAEAAAVSRLDGLTQQLLPELAAHWEAVAGPGADLWLASAAAHAGRPLAELQALLAARPAVLALAMEKFGGRLAWQEEAAWIAVHLREGLPSFAALFADDGPAARDCARRLVLEHGCLQVRPLVLFSSLLLSLFADAGAAACRGGGRGGGCAGAAAARQSGLSQRARGGRGR